MLKLRRWALPILLLTTVLAGLPALASDEDALDVLIHKLEQAEANAEQRAKLVSKIGTRWSVSPERVRTIIELADQNSDPVFPRQEHILAVIAIESGFNPLARSNGNVGLMQVNMPTHGRRMKNRSIQENIRIGSEILKDCYVRTHGNERAALLAYNVGLTGYQRGSYRTEYWNRFKRELAWIKHVS